MPACDIVFLRNVMLSFDGRPGERLSAEWLA